MANHVKILGFCASAEADALANILASVPGPLVSVYRAGELAAVAQADRPRGKLHVRRSRVALLRELASVQRRLEVACLHGPFLPADPAASCCADAAVDALLAPAWDRLARALAQDGARHQWDVILRWTPEAVVARRRDEIAAGASGRGPAGMAEAVVAALRAERRHREALLLAALTPAMVACAPGGAAGGETETAVTVLVPAGGEAAVEAALQRLDPSQFTGATLDMRGPLPPLSFGPVRVAMTEPGDVASAWRRLGLDLGETVDRARLHGRWRNRAAAAHPDRRPGASAGAAAPDAPAASVAELTQAYHVLRDLLAAEAGSVTLPVLLGRAGARLIVPSPFDLPAAALEAVA